MDRLTAARERVRSVKAELHSPAATLPCIKCRYFEIHCTHPAAAQISVSPVSGKTRATYFDPERMRADDGPCGPEGALFDSRSPFGLAVVSLLSKKATWWVALLVAAVGLDSLLR